MYGETTTAQTMNYLWSSISSKTETNLLREMLEEKRMTKNIECKKERTIRKKTNKIHNTERKKKRIWMNRNTIKIPSSKHETPIPCQSCQQKHQSRQEAPVQ